MRNTIYYASNRPIDRARTEKKNGRRCRLMMKPNRSYREPNWAGHSNLSPSQTYVNSSSSSTHHPIAICHFYFRFGSSPSALISKQIKFSVGLVKWNETGQNKQAIWIERWWRTFHNFLRHPNILLCVSVGRFRFIFSSMLNVYSRFILFVV